MLHFFSLALTPTAVIGVNKDLKIPPSFKLKCDARPSLFAYPEPLKEEVEEKKERVETAVLSITSKAKAKAALKEKEAGSESAQESMQVEKDEAKKATEAKKEKGEEKEGEEKKEEGEDKQEPEPECFEVSNPCRVTYSQQSFMSFVENQRYRPVRKDLDPRRNLGVLVLTDSMSGEPDDELRDIKAPPSIGEDGPEPEPPEPFEWVPPEYR